MVGSALVKYFLKSGWERDKNLFCYDADFQKRFLDDVAKSKILFICLPTPTAKDGSCDTSLVEKAVQKYHDPKRILVVKSTVEPGTIAKLQEKYSSPIIFNPEFLTEARSWENFIKPDRQVVAHTIKSRKFTDKILKILPRGKHSFSNLTASEAELGKYASNVFGAMKVAYSNIVADFASALEKVHAESGIKMSVKYDRLRHIVGKDPRIGDSWMNVNYQDYRGFGGYCFPKDLNAFINFGAKLARNLNKKNDQNTKKLVISGVDFLKSIRAYNDNLLKAQGLSADLVSRHDKRLKQLLKQRRLKNI